MLFHLCNQLISKVIIGCVAINVGVLKCNMMQYRLLGGTGIKLSIISMGGSGYGNVYGRYDKKTAESGLCYGLDQGINYIDTAPWYGQGKSEIFLGDVLKGISRYRYFIGTKVGRFDRNVFSMFNFGADQVIKSAEMSLKRLKLEYVDILQVHDVEFAPSIDIIINETLPALELLQKRGLCRFIGITGYSLPVLKTIVMKSHTNVDTILSYCRLALNDSSLIGDLDFYDSKGIGIINASPLGMGLLVPEPIQDWHPASNEIKQACHKAVKYCSSQNVDITRIALNYSTSFKQVMLLKH